MSETEFDESKPYVFVLRNAQKQPLIVGACPAETSWESKQHQMIPNSPWWDEVEDYILYNFTSEKRAWEYAIHIAEEFAPIYQPSLDDPSSVPHPGQLEAMMDPSPNPPKMVDPRTND